MELGLIGLGKMGSNMVKRLQKDKHKVVAFDISKDNVDKSVKDGAEGTYTLEELIKKLKPPRNVWVMVPHGKPTEETINKLLTLVEADDLIIDGGNSHYVESMKNAKKCNEKKIHFLDIGVSGGIWGLEVGYNMMIGGQEEDFKRLEPVLETLAPENGYAYFGKNGAGHFVKMIHNALEYVMLQGIGEAFECMYKSEFNIELEKAANLWNHGAVVRCWLLELAGRAFNQEGNSLKRIAPYIDDSGTGRWTTDFAVDNAIPIPTMTLSLYERFASREEESFSGKVIAALRNQFGGHAVKEDNK